VKQRITILSFAVFVLLSGVFSDFSYTYAGTEATEQSRKKKTTVSKTKSNSSFGQAFKEAKKKGQKTFKWNGKSFTTEKKSTTRNSSASKKTTTKKQTTASYKGVSFGKAYGDAKKKGFSEFKWNGKSYTTGTVKSKTSNKKITNKKKNITSKKKSVTNKKKSITSKKKSVTNNKKKITKRKTTPKRTYTTTRTYSPGVYTPPPNYGNTGTREYKRENSSGNENFRKEPKRE
jgi:hypothetical protein